MAESGTREEEDYAEARAYFSANLRAAHEAAEESGGFIDYFLQLGGHSLRLRFAGPALVPHVLPALAHSVTEAVADPNLTIHLCDSVSSGVAMPAPRWILADQTFRGGVPGCFSRWPYRTSYREWASVLSMLDLASGCGVFWTADARQLHFSMRGAPLRDLLHWWLGDHDCRLVHGAGVGTPEGGVLLTGRGSSGKSTTSLVCLNAGLLYAGDDHVAVSTEPTPSLYSLYNTAQLDVGGKHVFSDLIPIVETPGPSRDAKSSIYIHQHRPDSIIRSFPLRAIVLPRVTGRENTRLRTATAGEVLIALAPATIMALPRSGQAAMEQMAGLVRKVPGYVLELGTDLPQVPKVIWSLLSRN